MSFVASTQRLKMLLLILCLTGIAGITFAQSAAEEQITVNFKETDILSLIETMSAISGRNFVVDPRVKGKVTVVSARPVTPTQAYEIFVSVLKVNGYSVISSGSVDKIVLSADARQQSLPTVSAGDSLLSDRPVTSVIEVRHADVEKLVVMLKPLLPDDAHIVADTGSNTLLLTDSAANISRLKKVIAQLDVSDRQQLETYPLKHTQASEIENVIRQLAMHNNGQAKASGGAYRVVADERSNSLVIYGDQTQRSRIRQLLAKLDSPRGRSNFTEVIYLRHANAENLVAVLTGIGKQQLKAGETAAPAGSSQFDIQADPSTNALIITAPPFLNASLKTVVEKLDIRRAQVHIQAIIAEIKNDRALELGVEWSTGIPTEGRVGTISLPLSGGQTSSITRFPATVGAGFSLGYISSGTLKGLIKAFANDSDTNILSTPSIVTLDNEEASIHVGQNVPFVTGQYTNNDSNAGQNPFQTIERQDVGIKLRVKPHINEGNTIALNIEQEVSNVDSNAAVDGLVTNKRLIQTTVLVDNEEIIVLGGLVEDDVSESISKVPLLGDLPVLGNLFRSERTVKGKRNLMVFLRPQIIRDRDQLSQVTRDQAGRMPELNRLLSQQQLGIIMDESDMPSGELQ